jgi:hypothetical protein
MIFLLPPCHRYCKMHWWSWTLQPLVYLTCTCTTTDMRGPRSPNFQLSVIHRSF